MSDWPVPKDLHQVRSFLGFGNYFRKFIQGFSNLVQPLTRLTKAAVAFKWTDACQLAFEGVKWHLTHAPVLALADRDKPYELVADASGQGLGAVLMQDGRPIAYESRLMNSAEQNYTVSEKELLAVVHAMRTWRCYLEGAKGLVVVTDHKPNTFLSTQQMLSRRQARWAEFLQQFEFEFVYRPGRTNCADPLSRRHWPELAVLGWTLACPRGKQCKGREAADSPTSAPMLQGTNQWTGVGTHDCPSGAYYAGLENSSTLVERIRQGYAHDLLFLDDQGEGKRNVVQGGTLSYQDGLWYFDRRIAVPNDQGLRQLIMSELHDPPLSGHVGISKTRQSVTRDFWWPTLSEDVKAFVNTCDVCQRDKPRRLGKSGLLQSLQIPASKWSSVSMDFIMDLPTTKLGLDAILVFVDRLTKMAHFVATTTRVTAEHTAKLYVTMYLSYTGCKRSSSQTEILVLLLLFGGKSAV